jgi:DNA polymerase-3 subunit epsilon
MAVEDFVALDVETANADFGSICSIGLVHFRSGELFKKLTILVNPEDRFDEINISIHGIRPEQVSGAPTMDKVFPVIAQALSGTAIVHHSPFDKTAIARAATRYGFGALPCSWLDTLQVSRRAWKHFAGDGGYGLANLAKAFKIDFQHHDAAEDARAAGLILLRAMSETGVGIEDWLSQLERPAKKAAGFARVAREGDPTGPLAGQAVVFTGSLSISRESAAERAAAAGCKVLDSATKSVTLLVVGDQDLRLTKGQEKSTKHRKIEEMIAKGAAIRIVGESDFLLLTD